MFGICPTTASGSYSMSLGTSAIQVNSMLFEKAQMLRIFRFCVFIYVYILLEDSMARSKIQTCDDS